MQIRLKRFDGSQSHSKLVVLVLGCGGQISVIFRGRYGAKVASYWRTRNCCLLHLTYLQLRQLINPVFDQALDFRSDKIYIDNLLLINDLHDSVNLTCNFSLTTVFG